MKFEEKRPEEGRDGGKDTRRRLPQGKRPKGLPLLLFAISSLVLLLVLIANFGMESPTKELKNSELMVELDQGKVKSLELNSASDSGDFEVRGEFRNPAEGEPKAFKSRLSRQEWELLVREFQARPDKSRLTGVAFNTRMVDDLLGKFLISILPFIVLVLIVWFLFFRRSGGGIGGGVMQV